jgi:hypothetical protein
VISHPALIRIGDPFGQDGMRGRVRPESGWGEARHGGGAARLARAVFLPRAFRAAVAEKRPSGGAGCGRSLRRTSLGPFPDLSGSYRDFPGLNTCERFREVRKSAEKLSSWSEFPGTTNREIPSRISERPSSVNWVVLQAANMVMRVRGEPLKFCCP